MLQDKVLYIYCPHPRKLQIVLFSTGNVGESGKDSKRTGIILKETSNYFQTVMTIGRDIYPIKFELDIFGFDTGDFGLGNSTTATLASITDSGPRPYIGIW